MAIGGWRSASVVLIVALACAGVCRWLSDDLPPVRNVEGFTAQGFKRAADAFRVLLLSGEESGAAFAASYRGQLVVDLWGGYADFDAWRPWRKDSVSRTFLTTYGVAVAGVLLLADRQQIDLDRPVASYWPEFSANGKQAVTVAQLLRREVLIAPLETPVRLSQLPQSSGRSSSNSSTRQQAGSATASNQGGSSSSGSVTAAPDLSALLSDRPLVNASGEATAGTWQQQCELLELYLDQLVRRVDRRGRGLAEFTRDEIIKPHGLSCYPGLTTEVLPNATRLLLRRRSSSLAALADLLLSPGDLLCRLALSLGADTRWPVFDVASPSQLNDFDVQKAPVLSLNGFATARSLVRLYELLTGVGGGQGGGAALLSPAATSLLLSPASASGAQASASSSSWYEWMLGSGQTFTVSGLLKQQGITAAGNTVYVGIGNGGQYVLLDPETNLVMAYLTNQFSGYSAGLDPRFLAVLKAVYGCLPKS